MKKLPAPLNTPLLHESADLRLWSSVRVLLPQSALVFLLLIECKLVTQEKDLLMNSALSLRKGLQSGGLIKTCVPAVSWTGGQWVFVGSRPHRGHVTWLSNRWTAGCRLFRKRHGHLNGFSFEQDSGSEQTGTADPVDGLRLKEPFQESWRVKTNLLMLWLMVFFVTYKVILCISMVTECHFYLTAVTTLALDRAVLALCGCRLKWMEKCL